MHDSIYVLVMHANSKIRPAYATLESFISLPETTSFLKLTQFKLFKTTPLSRIDVFLRKVYFVKFSEKKHGIS